MSPDDLDVLYADESLLVLVKPAGLLSVPGRGEDKQDCLSARAQRQFPEARVVHRLDMATSGLMVMARSAAAQRNLNDAFASREIAKRYIAVVDGHLSAPPTPWGLIDLPIIELEPVTGRSHQLRVHLRAIGHAIAGDQLYGAPRVQAMADRLLLHACSLEFKHPTTGQVLQFVSPAPF